MIFCHALDLTIMILVRARRTFGLFIDFCAKNPRRHCKLIKISGNTELETRQQQPQQIKRKLCCKHVVSLLFYEVVEPYSETSVKNIA